MSKTEITLPILNGITPTFESCTMKVIEEVGELMQMIGKHSGMSGEKQIIAEEVRIRRAVFEALDVAQSAITMAHTLCKEFGLPLDSYVAKHEDKLRQKGYLVIGSKSKNPYKGAEALLKKIEQKCINCRYELVTKEILDELGYDPCERCGEDCREWEPNRENRVTQDSSPSCTVGNCNNSCKGWNNCDSKWKPKEVPSDV